ncbi:hypothetical protein [uncultured Veillonella sp.]|uniref:hypothetical protein n=1 Tax=uncultured Veillonella sp. TaxID=159268 RepID=UPI0025DC3A4A|nr:hypothetical protein [uncultured Veillonella sp.]MDY3974469.1 hypothetical protein [Veillonella caviae]
MNQTSKSMEKKIRSVKTWLDKAEQAYADDSTAKGQLQLMLAKAEMQHLDEQQDSTKRYKLFFIGAVLLALLVVLGVYFINTLDNKPAGQPTDMEFNTTIHNTNGIGNTPNPAGTTSGTSNVKPTIGPGAGMGMDDSQHGNQHTVQPLPDGSKVNTSDSVNATSSDEVQTVQFSAAGGASEMNPGEASASTSGQDYTTQTAPQNEKEDTIAEPVISNSQIQEAVREGGRSLRGQ